MRYFYYGDVFTPYRLEDDIFVTPYTEPLAVMVCGVIHIKKNPIAYRNRIFYI
jgi:hypothetical protein